ncbi:helix-turn-helix domain-containing protein [uncultured Arsenicicoccus sp.]|uniref:helix-turn-helix domain-containing protein n=1 Tax=uncultured Arsenicicoccus sp. TaxID=491339 RepID=UPI002597923D|nr:helix-turn-helix domain-containing protein [uncultured Arsenicicoccus sp.]
MARLPVSRIHVTDLGAYLREQREAAQLSLRQLSELAGVSNPYLSQIERGLRHPSAEILNALAKGLQISAESLYVRAGFLDGGAAAEDDGPATGRRPGTPSVVEAITADPSLSARQRRTLVDLYRQLAEVSGEAGPGGVDDADADAADQPSATPPARAHATTRRTRSTR